MKAKDMVVIYKEKPTTETLVDLIFQLISETKTIAEQRKIKSDSAMTAILREQHDKFKAFVRLLPPNNNINPDGFKISLHAMVPVSKSLLP